MKYILQLPGQLKIGGAEKVAANIGLFADRSKYEVHYVVFGDRIGEYEQELTEHRCRVFHMLEPAQGYLRYMRLLKELLARFPYSVVHAHTMFNAGWAMLAAKEAGVPVRIAHAHSALVNGRSMKKQAYELCMRELILRNATDLVACGDAAGVRLFGEKAYERSGKRILNGVDVDRFAFREETRERMRAELCLQDAFVIVHVGHLAAVKNQSFLIRLLPQIMKNRPNAILLLLGEGEDRPMLQKLIRENRLEDRVIMTGNVGNVQDYLCAADVFAFPSLFEGMPLSVVEVQANGLPCILSTGVPKDVYLTDLVRPLPLNDEAAWVDAICTAERHCPQRYTERLKEEGFDAESSMRKLFTIYERVDKE